MTSKRTSNNLHIIFYSLIVVWVISIVVLYISSYIGLTGNCDVGFGGCQPNTMDRSVQLIRFYTITGWIPIIAVGMISQNRRTK